MTILTKSVRLVWRNPYITDGLIAMWDGEWNAGGGIHDPSAQIWEDLVNHTPTISNLSNYGAWETNAFDFTKTTGAQLIAPFCPCSCGTWEIVANSYYSANDTCNLYMYTPLHNAACVRHDYSSVRGGKTRLGWTFASQYKAVINQNEVANNQPLLFSLSGCLDRDNRANDCFYHNGVYVGRFTYAESISVDGSFALYISLAIKIKLHCIRYYSRLLSPEEVAANYAVDRVRFGLP